MRLQAAEYWALSYILQEDELHDGFWVDWALDRLDKVDSCPAWLAELATAASRGEALAALGYAFASDDLEGERPAWRAPELGFMYRRHQRGELSLHEFLEQAGGHADVRNFHDPSCEEIFELLNELEGVCPPRWGWGSLEERTKALFAPFVREAEEALAVIVPHLPGRPAR